VKSYIFRVELEQDDDGRWSAVVPTLPGCAVWGYSAEEALAAIREATETYIEILIEDGREIPLDEGTTVVDGPAVSVVA
jgi:predicted RNase H-like HicB family nuclease